MSSLGLPSIRKILTYWRVSSKVPPRWSGDWRGEAERIELVLSGDEKVKGRV